MLSGTTRDKLKKIAIDLRKRGLSYPMIEKRLGVSRSTLSGWLNNLELTPHAQSKIFNRKIAHLQKIRLKAVRILRDKYAEERKNFFQKAREDLDQIQFNKFYKELLLTMLYLGEGFKRRSIIALGNSNPDIVIVFVKLIREIYQVENKRLRCFLYLRYDQNILQEQKFWSKRLGIPMSQFRKAQLDKRTIGKKTWNTYHGVCAVYCHDARIEKRLTALQELLMKKIILGG